MADYYRLLTEQFEKIGQLEHAITFLQWDHMVMMPPGGSEARARAIAEITSLHHELLTATQLGDYLAEAKSREKDPLRLRSILEMEREYSQAICLPPELVKAQSLAGSKCEHGWRKQRKRNDWQGFLANFKEVVRLAREEASARFDSDPDRFLSRYDAMVDLYCTGDSSPFISGVFATLREKLPGLIQEIVAKQSTTQVPKLTGHYSIDKQKQLSKELMTTLGFNFDHGRIDVSAHPFSTGCRGDQRITTRYRETDFFDALLATAHETGHASYEDGLPGKWDNLPIGSARNLCIHESQSLLFEKQIFLSKCFMDYFTTILHQHLPSTSEFTSQELWLAATRVTPSYIRVEADEATYPLHVILRYDLESDLINQKIEAEDIPALWDQGMQQYLGISTKDNYCNGCLQDMHWTDGSFGYFPSYTIGALNGAQLFHTIKNDHPNWFDQLGRGKVGFVREWLQENIWSKGSSMDSQQIISDATGQGTNPQFFLQHLKDRYLEERY